MHKNLNIFIEPIDRTKNPAAWYKFHYFLEKSLKESTELNFSSKKNADFILTHVLNDKMPLEDDEKKLIILDWSDNSSFLNIPCLFYFKKSWAQHIEKNNVIVKKEPSNIKSNWRPLQEMVLPSYFRPLKEKNKELICTLRNIGKGDAPNRKLVLDVVGGINLPGIHAGALHIEKFGKKAWEKGQPKKHIDYLNFISSAKIIVTCGPSNWEGDSRLWESLASGACVITDKIYANMGFNPIDKEHCFFYDIDDINTLYKTIEYAYVNKEISEKIGHSGRLLAATKHSPYERLKQIIHTIKNEN